MDLKCFVVADIQNHVWHLDYEEAFASGGYGVAARGKQRDGEISVVVSGCLSFERGGGIHYCDLNAGHDGAVLVRYGAAQRSARALREGGKGQSAKGEE